MRQEWNAQCRSETIVRDDLLMDARFTFAHQS